jgi:hypothetical protein
MNCPYEAPPLNKDVYWREGESVLMPKGTSKVKIFIYRAFSPIEKSFRLKKILVRTVN